MNAVIMLQASSFAGPAAARRRGRASRLLATIAMLLLAGAEVRAAEAVAAAARSPAGNARFDDRFPEAPDTFADRFPQTAAPTELAPKRVLTTIEHFPRRGAEVRASEARRPSPPPAVAPAASVRAY